MNFQTSYYVFACLLVLAAVIFPFRFLLSEESRTEIYKLIFCGQCPHKQIQQQLKLWNQKITEFNTQYPNIDLLISQRGSSLEQCQRKLSTSQIDVAKQELALCINTLNQIINDLKQNQEHQFKGRLLEPQQNQDLPLIVD